MTDISRYKALRRRIAMERKVVREIVKAALALNLAVSIENGANDGLELERHRDFKKIMRHVRRTDEDVLHFGYDGQPSLGWVYLVYGNDGYDVVNDYTTNLDELFMARINEMTYKMMQEEVR